VASWSSGPDAGDPAFLDVAACLAGVSPAWSGGPLCWGASPDGA
jgi:3-hydroxyacyl-CoA dehydrogenase/enoyl-CoA hydratase/3-hydroxybutyryl-CoA epimerase